MPPRGGPRRQTANWNDVLRRDKHKNGYKNENKIILVRVVVGRAAPFPSVCLWERKVLLKAGVFSFVICFFAFYFHHLFLGESADDSLTNFYILSGCDCALETRKVFRRKKFIFFAQILAKLRTPSPLSEISFILTSCAIFCVSLLL